MGRTLSRRSRLPIFQSQGTLYTNPDSSAQNPEHKPAGYTSLWAGAGSALPSWSWCWIPVRLWPQGSLFPRRDDEL